MATNTRIDPLKQQRAGQWAAFINQYHPSANDIKDEASWFRWKQRLAPGTREAISDKLFTFKNDFDDLGGYDALATMQKEATKNTRHASSSGHGSGGHGAAAHPTLETPEQIREREKKEAAEKIIRRFFKENPVNYQRALMQKYLPTDPRYTALVASEGAQEISPNQRGELGDPRAHNTARERFFSYHTGAMTEYYKKERGVIYGTQNEDPMWTASKRELQLSYGKLIEPTNTYYADALTKLGGQRAGEIGREEYTRGFVESFPEKAAAYAPDDLTIQKAIQDLQVEQLEEEEQEEIPNMPPLSIPQRTPQPEEEDTQSDGSRAERDRARSHTRDERQSQANESGSQPPNNRPPANNNSNGFFSRGKKKAGDLAQKGVKKIGNAVGNALKKETKEALKEGAKQLVQKGLAATSEYWAPVLLVITIIILLIIFIFMLLGMASQKAQEDENKTLPITVTKSVNKTEMKNPSDLPPGERLLTYTVAYSYGGKAKNILTADSFPKGVELESATGNFTLYDSHSQPTTDKTKATSIVWSAAGEQPQASDSATTTSGTESATTASQTFTSGSYTVVLRVPEIIKDTYLINQATASVIGAETKTGATGNTASNPNATTFFDLMKGQGRNTTVLGDENAFVSAVMQNGANRFGGNVSSDNLHALYIKAIAKNVNPLIILTIWGVEQSFTANDPMFGCLGFPAGFSDQMSCAVNSINNHMDFFEQEEKKGNIPYVITTTDPSTNVVHSCPFTDAFEYAYERYTPVCLMDDGNDNSRKNFTTIYKELLGVK